MTDYASPKETYDYEKNMYLNILAVLQGDSNYEQSHSSTEKYALVEALLFHTRNLVDIFLSRGTKVDDIRLEDIAPSYSSPNIDRLREAYGNTTRDESPCWRINKRIAHPTKKRLKNTTDYTDLVVEIDPIIRAIISGLNVSD